VRSAHPHFRWDPAADDYSLWEPSPIDAPIRPPGIRFVAAHPGALESEVKLYLARHAKAQRRDSWNGPDAFRPLTDRGERQAHGLQARFAAAPLQVILSSPALRCRESVEGIATVRGLGVEIEASFDEGAPLEKTMARIATLGDQPALVCTHGDLVRGILAALHVDRIHDSTPLGCEKGAMWLLEGPGDRVVRATYVPPLEADPLVAGGTRIAVMDLGSTTFSLLVADATRDGEIEPVLREKVSLRLGAAVADGPKIPESVCKDAVEAVRVLLAQAASVHAEIVVPVATAAFREASNGRDLAKRIGKEIGVPVRLLSGEQEARTVALAVRRRVGFETGTRPALVLDLGGGSLELVLDDAHGGRWDTTLPLGVARLHREIVETDPMTDREARRIRKRVRSALEDVLGDLARCGPDGIVTGGTARALARLRVARERPAGSGPIRALRISTPELWELSRTLREANHDERLAMPGMQRRRADLLPAGALILATLAERLALEAYVVSDWGLREGAILETLGAI